jgi:hypothetical protein
MDSQVEKGALASRTLPVLRPNEPHAFVKPAKRIHEGQDVHHFLTSQAYRDIGIFVMQLNISMCPRKSGHSDQVETWRLDSPLILSGPVQKLQELLGKIDSMIEEAPPSTGPRRFGNVSFRTWYEILESRAQGLLKDSLPKGVLEFRAASADGVSVLDELTPYLLGGFGSPQRLDYGTGHELSFLAFVACIWKLGGFTSESSVDGALERSIVIGVIEPYVAPILQDYFFLISYVGIYGSSVALFLPIRLNQLDLMGYGVWTTIHSCLTFSVLRNTALPLRQMMLCRLKGLLLVLPTQATLPRRLLLTEKGNTTCTSQLWVSLMMLKLALFGSTVLSCLTYLEFALAGARLIRFGQSATYCSR